MTSSTGVKRAREWPEQLILAPEERREAVLRLIRSAEERLILSVFRCTDYQVMDELAEALRRKVQVELLLTRRAKGWKKRLRELGAYLEGLGAQLHRYAGRGVKYHAKYLVADDGPALVTSLNFTRKCFSQTCDFLLVTHDSEVVAGLKRLFETDCYRPESPFPEGLSDRLVVAPERARPQLSALLQGAQRSLSIIDHKLDDPAMLALLKAKQQTGVEVRVLGKGEVGELRSHGKMILVDETVAVIGSLALTTASLNRRRELALEVRDPRCVAQLTEFFQAQAAAYAAAGAANRAARQEEELEDEETRTEDE